MSEIQKGLVYAIIPARSGSKGVVDKNIRKVAGHPMLAYSIAAAQLTPGIQRIIVSTDSPKYAEISCQYGAETPFLRPESISGSKSTDIEFMLHAIKWFQDNEQVLPEFWVHLRPTAPLRDPSILQSALEKMLHDPTADSLRSAHRSEACPFKWFWKSEDGYFQTLNGISLDDANGPRQAFPTVYIPDGYVDILRTSYIQQYHLLHGKRMIAFESPENTIDVDHISDFEKLQETVSREKNDLAIYLNRIVGER